MKRHILRSRERQSRRSEVVVLFSARATFNRALTLYHLGALSHDGESSSTDRHAITVTFVEDDKHVHAVCRLHEAISRVKDISHDLSEPPCRQARVSSPAAGCEVRKPRICML